MNEGYPPLADLAPIGDRRTAALVGRDATIWWYTPHRFDRPALLLGLLDAGKGGWRIELPGAQPAGRRYLEQSAVLETQLATQSGNLAVTDWLNLGGGARPGMLCRGFSAAPADTRIVLAAWDDWGRARVRPRLVDGVAVLGDGLHLFCSHPLRCNGQGEVEWVLPRGEEGWAALAEWPCDAPQREDLEKWRQSTLGRWAELARRTTYDGPYQAAVEASLRQLRLLVYEPTGAVVAAVTAGLPEVVGGKRDYDYRYSWLRDTSMVVRALLRAAKGSKEGEAFVGFAATAHRFANRRWPVDAVVAVDGRPIAAEDNPPLAGYAHSRPVRIGNRAGRQLQLGALGDLLLAAGCVFRERGAAQHWPVIERVADFLVGNWRAADSGIWESPRPRQYTASKVFAACGLEAIAAFADPPGRERYCRTAAGIRDWVMRHCLTRDGAFATFAGAEGVDVSAALFPIWGFCRPEMPAMTRTIEVLERDYQRDGLFRRDDRTGQHQYEGAFLPATFWMAQYAAASGDPGGARHYIDAGLKYANDVGVLAEEVDWESGVALGNLPLGMTHASLVNAIIDVAQCEMRPQHADPASAMRAPVSAAQQ